MKKVLLFLFVAVLAIAFTSCSKKGDYSCDCVSVYSTGDTINSSTTLTNVKKSDAQTTCDNASSTASSGGVTITTTCTLSKK